MKQLFFLITLLTVAASAQSLYQPDKAGAPDYRSPYTGEFVFTTYKYTSKQGRDTAIVSKLVETRKIHFQPSDSVLIDMRPYTDAKKYAAVRLGEEQKVAIDKKGNFILNIPKGITFERGQFIGTDSVFYEHWNHHHSGRISGTVVTARRAMRRAIP